MLYVYVYVYYLFIFLSVLLFFCFIQTIFRNKKFDVSHFQSYAPENAKISKREPIG